MDLAKSAAIHQSLHIGHSGVRRCRRCSLVRAFDYREDDDDDHHHRGCGCDCGHDDDPSEDRAFWIRNVPSIGEEQQGRVPFPFEMGSLTRMRRVLEQLLVGQ